MFASKDKGTVIAKGLKIVGSVTAEGLVEFHGQIEGELHGTSLVIARGAHVVGTITAQRVVVDGNVEGPIQGVDVMLKSHANVVGDIRHQSLSIENGAIFEGCSARASESREAEGVGKKPLGEKPRNPFPRGVSVCHKGRRDRGLKKLALTDGSLPGSATFSGCDRLGVDLR